MESGKITREEDITCSNGVCVHVLESQEAQNLLEGAFNNYITSDYISAKKEKKENHVLLQYTQYLSILSLS